MRIVRRRNEISLKVVYYGPGLAGKTTNLVHLHGQVPDDRRGKLIQLDTDTERTLFFDYFPKAAGRVGKYTIKIDFFTVPGQSFYAATRKAVLDGADGIVFVADSGARREQANLVSHADMVRTLAEQGRCLEEVPHVFQYNKRDLPGAMSVKLLRSMLNPHDAPDFEAVASEGVGVQDTQDAVVRLTLERLTQRRRSVTHV
jgi:signal recognition particle receptor subunit beta